MKICVIFNPAARGAKAARFRDHLGALSAQCSLKPTYATGSGRGLAAEAVREGFELIVAAGGDGTVNEVLNGIGDVPDGFARACLGVLPLGTVNVFAKELCMPGNLAAAWQVLLRGKETRIDLPQADYATVAGGKQSRFFAQMAGAGVDSRAIELVLWEQKKRLGALAYVVACCKAMRGPQPQIAVTDGVRSVVGELILIGNGAFYGGRYRVFPLADLRDGLLEVSVFPRADWPNAFRYGLGLLTDRLYSGGGVKHLQAPQIQVQSESAVPFHLEGENIAPLPAHFSVRREALRVVVP